MPFTERELDDIEAAIVELGGSVSIERGRGLGMCSYTACVEHAFSETVYDVSVARARAWCLTRAACSELRGPPRNP
jgi:hypothetical protein